MNFAVFFAMDNCRYHVLPFWPHDTMFHGYTYGLAYSFLFSFFFLVSVVVFFLF